MEELGIGSRQFGFELHSEPLCLVEGMRLDEAGRGWEGIPGRGVSRNKGKMRKYRTCSGSYTLRGVFFLFVFASFFQFY